MPEEDGVDRQGARHVRVSWRLTGEGCPMGNWFPGAAALMMDHRGFLTRDSGRLW